MDNQPKGSKSIIIIVSILIMLVLVFGALGYGIYNYIYTDTSSQDKFDKYDEMAEILAQEAEKYNREKATAQDIFLSFNAEDRDTILELHENPDYVEDGIRSYDEEITTYTQILNSGKEHTNEEKAWLEQRLAKAIISKYFYRRDTEAVEETKRAYELLKTVVLNEDYPKVVRADAARLIADAILVDMNMEVASIIYTGPLFGEIITRYEDPTSMAAVMLSSGDLYRYSAFLYKEPDSYFAAALVYLDYIVMNGSDLSPQELSYYYELAQEQYDLGAERLDVVVERFNPKLELYQGAGNGRISGYFRQKANVLRRMYVLQTEPGDALSQAEYISSIYETALKLVTTDISEIRKDAYALSAARVAANYGIWLYRVYGANVPSTARNPEELADYILESPAAREYFADLMKTSATPHGVTQMAGFGVLSPRLKQFLLTEAGMTEADFQNLELPNRGLMKPKNN